LQEIFVSMHDARWINLKPLSLIPRLVQEHFVGMISSPPLNINMPPRPRDSIIEPRMLDADALARVGGEGLIQYLAAVRAEQGGPGNSLTVVEPQPGDSEAGQYLTFDFLRMGTVSRTQKTPIMPAHKFQFDLGTLPMHFSCAAMDIIACKEAMWDHLKELGSELERRDYDALIRQYQA
jgi:hypothetical protein